MQDKDFDDATKRHDGSVDFAESHPRLVPGTDFYEPLDQRPPMSLPDWVQITPVLAQNMKTGERIQYDTVSGRCGPITKNSDQYTVDYYLRGKELGISGYTDYRWLPDLTLPMVRSIITHCGIDYNHKILDFGCARGYVVRAFREMGYDAYGTDVSEWAVANCDPEARGFVFNHYTANADWVIAKDVLEHVPNVADVVADLMQRARVGVFAVVPLSVMDGQPYVVEEYEKDVTHIHRLTLATWARMFVQPGWCVEMRYRLHGVKDNYAQFLNGNGFLTSKRIR